MYFRRTQDHHSSRGYTRCHGGESPARLPPLIGRYDNDGRVVQVNIWSPLLQGCGIRHKSSKYTKFELYTTLARQSQAKIVYGCVPSNLNCGDKTLVGTWGWTFNVPSHRPIRQRLSNGSRRRKDRLIVCLSYFAILSLVSLTDER